MARICDRCKSSGNLMKISIKHKYFELCHNCCNDMIDFIHSYKETGFQRLGKMLGQ